ncbi:hypothetical protein G6M89_16990 [Natronolimnobius sp. AArcel1]|uniref:hypothetical protein n=1 Tax=Natronolimnobius sp. AArcel1 TaxID=1679093 RepID=UPI0013ED3730|nr:hypothetical protein [Natronolimnobius sp. AArcel1]NGM70681.1 hypothetical protein [Natronolimnobius sp. AArcel1]
MDKLLEVLTVATSSLLIAVLAVVLVAPFNPEIAIAISGLETSIALICYGYLWLLTLVAASQGTLLDVPNGQYRQLVTDSAVVGAGVTIVFVTVLLIVEFVVPDPILFDPASISVLWLVTVSTIAGGIAGIGFGTLYLCCDRLAASLVPRVD